MHIYTYTHIHIYAYFFVIICMSISIPIHIYIYILFLQKCIFHQEHISVDIDTRDTLIEFARSYGTACACTYINRHRCLATVARLHDNFIIFHLWIGYGLVSFNIWWKGPGKVVVFEFSGKFFHFKGLNCSRYCGTLSCSSVESRSVVGLG